MATPRHLNKAPIREALIDIQFEPQISLATLREFVDAVNQKFDRQANIWQQSFGIEFAKEGDSKSSSEQSVLGWRLDSDERGLVVQARINGFSISKLAPYKDWKEIKAAAKEIWEQFVRITKPTTVSRVAVRYINALEIPLPIADFSDYLTASPQVPTALPQALTAFLQRVIMVDPKTRCVAAVTQALEEPQAGTQLGAITIFLDIDCFTVKVIAPDTEELWETLDDLRDYKNTIFFEHITERTAELYS